MPKVELDQIEQTNRTGYPAPFDQPVDGRWYRRLAPSGGLTEFAASYVTLRPGAWSSQRHWHEGEDELVVMLAGEAVLIEDDGETVMRAGDVAAFPKGVRNGHHLVNRSDSDCRFVAVGVGRNLAGAIRISTWSSPPTTGTFGRMARITPPSARVRRLGSVRARR